LPPDKNLKFTDFLLDKKKRFLNNNHSKHVYNAKQESRRQESKKNGITFRFSLSFSPLCFAANDHDDVCVIILPETKREILW